MKSKTTNFDELDLKCLAELPLVIDVLASTGNKIAQIFKPITDECDKIIKNNMPNDWAIDTNKSYNLLFFPFYAHGLERKVSTETLANTFKMETSFYIFKKVNKKHVNFLWIYFGYNFANEEDENENSYYFSITKDPASEKYEGVINTNDFYKQVVSKNKLFQVEYDHPDRGGNRESIDVKINEHNIDLIQNGFEFFKNEILIPTLKNIK